jgi:DNA-binding XRE family transcriptional regulator
VNTKSDLDDFLAEALADPESRARFEEIAPLVDFGCAVAIAREQRRMSLQSLAAAAGISRSALIQIEKGNNAPTLITQTKIARALNARLEIAPSGRIDFVLFPKIIENRTPERVRIATVAKTA